jgi:hypothetical protein
VLKCLARQTLFVGCCTVQCLSEMVVNHPRLTCSVVACPTVPAAQPTHTLPLPQAEARLSSQRAAVEEAEQAVQEALRLLREAEVGPSFVHLCVFLGVPTVVVCAIVMQWTRYPDCAPGHCL